MGHNSADENLQEFMNLSFVYDINDKIIEQTIDLRKNYKIKVPDAIIAATALVHNFTLVTRNTGDFERIPGLELLNPRDI